MINLAYRMEAIPFSGIRKIVEEVMNLENSGRKIIHMEIGRPDFDTPAHIKEAAAKALEGGFVHYTSNYGLIELREAICQKLKEDNNLNYSPEEIIVTVGANEAVLMVMLAFLNPGDEILIPDPSWLHYFYCATLAGATPVPVPTFIEDNFALKPEEIEKRITGRTRMLVVNTPHNPTGAVYSKELQTKIADLAAKYNLVVLADEIYEKIIYDGAEHFSIASLPGMRERTITVNGFSKVYSMTGWRLGYLAADRELIKGLIRIHQYTTVCACSFAQKGAVAALTGSQQCVADMVAEFERRRNLVAAVLNDMKIPYVMPSGAFYIFPDFREYGQNSEKMAEYLLREAEAAVVPGSHFGRQGEGFLRMAFSNSYENLEAGLEKMASALRKLKR